MGEDLCTDRFPIRYGTGPVAKRSEPWEDIRREPEYWLGTRASCLPGAGIRTSCSMIYVSRAITSTSSSAIGRKYNILSFAIKSPKNRWLYSIHNLPYGFFVDQVCGLKWSHDDRELASGGNDNQLSCSLEINMPQIVFRSIWFPVYQCMSSIYRSY